MKSTLLQFIVLALLAAPAWAQGISVGVRAGVPLSDAFDAVPNVFRNVPHRWTAGPTVEVRFPFALGLTFDALYSKVEYEGLDGQGRASGGQWDFPLMLRFRPGAGPIRPFVAGGGSFNKLTDISTPKSTVAGLVLGAGLEVKAPFIRIAPEIRYTHRFDDAVRFDGLRSNRDQFLFLTGITF